MQYCHKKIVVFMLNVQKEVFVIERLSPDGLWIARGTDEGDIGIRRIVSGSERWSVAKAHQGAVRVIVWSPDGSALASGGDDAIVKVWAVLTGMIVALYTQHTGPITALDWSPDGCWVTSAADTGGPHVWHSSKEMSDFCSEHVPGASSLPVVHQLAEPDDPFTS